ncbi:MAG: hypothetical protein BWY76_02055 [bacterium ADurb.Bin429]|nr:MAG: hypothetical protein BWY76_02055 [bacterium ADurb.Bin429]
MRRGTDHHGWLIVTRRIYPLCFPALMPRHNSTEADIEKLYWDAVIDPRYQG